MKYGIIELNSWVIVSISGKAENNEPLRVNYLFKRWLMRRGVRVIVNLKGIEELGVWEVGLLTSFKKEMDQRGGVLRICNLNASLNGYFHNDRFSEHFEIYPDLESAMEEQEVKKDGE